MGAPSATSRETPSGIKLDDGYQTLITVLADPDISVWEKSITPPGLDGGDANDTTTMHNVTYRTFSPRALKTMTEMTTTVAYDPDIYDEILAVINEETTITVTFPDGSTLAFFGYVRVFAPSEVVEGTQPEATITIQPTNQDSDGAEQGAVMTEGEGT